MPWRSLIATAFLAVVSGCATSPTETASEPEADPEPGIPFIRSIPDTPPPASDVTIDPPAIAIVMASRSPAYEDVAIALADHFDTVSIYDLSDRSQPPVSAFRLINDGSSDVVVAIGLRAANSSLALSDAPVVFSQVFNYQDHALLGERSRGIAAIAPMAAQLAAWKEAEPTLSSVGFVIGPGHDALIEEAELAAERHGVQLVVNVANSDQEALYFFKRMVRDIDGFWLLPDNRVLSSRMLRKAIDQANQHGVSVLAPNQSLLSIGATISVSTVPTDVADRIREVVERINQGQLQAVAPITALTEIRVDVNEALLQRQTVAKGSREIREDAL
ncbi:MAG: ABC transporter substrate binding protein [Woeseiaceae bacterium]|nr:ABC transporter substrate binding protein [Woeseiaceae bacterium]